MASDFSATLIPDSSGTVISVVLMWVKKDICTYKDLENGIHTSSSQLRNVCKLKLIWGAQLCYFKLKGKKLDKIGGFFYAESIKPIIKLNVEVKIITERRGD